VAQADVAVVGVGIVGASAVYALARAGAHVIAIDADRPGSGTSRTSFAWVNSVRKEPEGYHRLNAEGMAAHRALARDLGPDYGYHDGGSLEWSETADAAAELKSRVERLAGRGYAAAFIRRKDAEGLEPALRIPAHVEDVAFYAMEGWLDAPRAIACLLGAARGADVRTASRVRAVRRRHDRVEALVLDDGEIVAESVLVCVGPATQAFLAPWGVTIPLGRTPGVLAVTSPPARPLGRVVHAPGIHLRPDAGGGLLLGASDVDELVTELSPRERLFEAARRLLERAARVFPAAEDVELADARVGVRPMPGDGVTIAGRIPGVRNAWMLATHSGVTLGPLLGRLIADEIVGGASSPTLAPFRPDRFA
jgi:glycine/D-amino acid oxidase-like deaminating enzyme